MSEDRLRQCRIMVVEPSQVRATTLERLLVAAGYQQILQIDDPWEVVEATLREQPAVVLLSMDLPQLDGFGVLQLLTKEVPADAQMPVILMGDNIGEAERRRGLSAGVFDFLPRPLDEAEVLLRVRSALWSAVLKLEAVEGRLTLEEQLRVRTSELDGAQTEILERLAVAAEYCDDETGDHARRVGTISGMIARQMGLDPATCDTIRRAAPLHDVGKVGVPAHILGKAGSLTEEEMTVMKTHTTIGARIVFGSHPTLWLAGEVCVNHHERWDGSGYPWGKAGEQIPLAGRIVAVADVYDTLCGSRGHRLPWPHDEAFDEIRAQSGRQFDPAVVEAFLALPHPLFVEATRGSSA